MANRYFSYKWVVPTVILAMGIGSYLYYSRDYRIKVEQGNQFENIVAPGINGEAVSLYGIKNKLVLVQFWASWCAPCMREMPELKAVYEAYNHRTFRNADGFEVFAYALDADTAKWKNALQRLEIPWAYNVNEGKSFRSNTAQRLGVSAIPTNVLIDPQHNIVGVDLDMDDLAKTLERFRK